MDATLDKFHLLAKLVHDEKGPDFLFLLERQHQTPWRKWILVTPSEIIEISLRCHPLFRCKKAA